MLVAAALLLLLFRPPSRREEISLPLKFDSGSSLEKESGIDEWMPAMCEGAEVIGIVFLMTFSG